MIFSKFFNDNKKKEIKIPKKREISLKHSLNTLFLEKMPIHLILINKNKVIKQFNSLAKEDFDLKIGYNISLISLNSHSIKKIKKLNISGIFVTNIPEYDNHIIYGDIMFFCNLLFAFFS